MGYYIKFRLRVRVRVGHEAEALRIANLLHTDEWLLAHARGRSFPDRHVDAPVSERRWYAFVAHPKAPYSSLAEALTNWNFEDAKLSHDDDGRLALDAQYDMKEGQVAFFLEQMAPHFEDTQFEVVGEDDDLFRWSFTDGVFTQQAIVVVADEDPMPVADDSDPMPVAAATTD